MAEGREHTAWNHTSAVMFGLLEPNRDKKKQPKPYTPDDFHPMIPKPPKAQKTWTMREIRDAMERGANID